MNILVEYLVDEIIAKYLINSIWKKIEIIYCRGKNEICNKL